MCPQGLRCWDKQLLSPQGEAARRDACGKVRRQREGWRTTPPILKSRDWQRSRGDWRGAPYTCFCRELFVSLIFKDSPPLLKCIFNIYILTTQLIQQPFLENIVLNLNDKAKTLSITVAHLGPHAREAPVREPLCIFSASVYSQPEDTFSFPCFPYYTRNHTAPVTNLSFS